MGIESHRLQRGEGSGSRAEIDDKYDSEEYQDKDERAPTRTTFYERDINDLEVSEDRKQRLRRMLRRQRGEQPGEAYSQNYDSREQQNRSEWKRRVVSAFASQLELTSTQKERVKHLVNDVLDINTFGYYSTEQVVLATVNVVAREDGRFIEDEEMFRRLMGDSGITDEDRRPDLETMRSLRRLVRDRLPSKQ